MIGILLAIFSAFLHSLYFVFIKLFVKDFDWRRTLFWISFTICLIIILLYVFGLYEIHTSSWFYLFIFLTWITNFIWLYLSYKSLELGDISSNLPLLSFSPIFVVIISFFSLWELPSIYGILWIILIVFWAYIIDYHRNKWGKINFFGKWAIYMFLASIVFAFTMTLFKISLMKSNLLLAIWFMNFTVLILSFISLLLAWQNIADLFINTKNLKILIPWIIYLLSDIMISIALSYQFVSYIMAIKRFSIVFWVLFWWLIFWEKNVLTRLWGTLLMFAWMVLIIFLW